MKPGRYIEKSMFQLHKLLLLKKKSTCNSYKNRNSMDFFLIETHPQNFTTHCALLDDG